MRLPQHLVTERATHTEVRGRVVILEPLSNGLDTSSLHEHGEIAVIFGSTSGMHQTPSVFRTDDYVTIVQNWLKNNHFNPSLDKFVMAGRLTKLAVAVAALIRLYPEKQVTVLIYDGGSSKYVERTL